MSTLDSRYKITKTFEENKKSGPFETVRNQNTKIRKTLGNYGIETDFFGFKTMLPIGVAAGPIYNKDYMMSATKDGFEVITWKTFRSEDRQAHRNDGSFLGHNIVFIEPQRITKKDIGGKITGQIAPPGKPENISITNSFGMPSSAPSTWMPEVTEMESWIEKHNKKTVTSVVGTPREGGDIHDLARDYAFLARAAETAGAHVVELNLSCPNVSGREGMLYTAKKDCGIIVKTTREALASKQTKVLIKLGYATKAHYKALIKACAPYIDGVVGINTIPMEVVDNGGKQALPGGMKSGVCGYAILDMAVQAVENLVQARKELGLTKKQLKIVSCGGVTDVEGFMRHIQAGSEFVTVATSALFNPRLPLDIAKYLKEHKIKKKI